MAINSVSGTGAGVPAGSGPAAFEHTESAILEFAHQLEAAAAQLPEAYEALPVSRMHFFATLIDKFDRLSRVESHRLLQLAPGCVGHYAALKHAPGVREFSGRAGPTEWPTAAPAGRRLDPKFAAALAVLDQVCLGHQTVTAEQRDVLTKTLKDFAATNPKDLDDVTLQWRMERTLGVATTQAILNARPVH